MSSTSAVSVLAQGLRELRDFAEGPDGEELRERTGLTAEQIDTALEGARLPTREVTLALVEAWGGDVEAWREYWGRIAELAEEDDSERATSTPAPPEPSIITPMVEQAGVEQAGVANAGAEPVEARGDGPELVEPVEATEPAEPEEPAEAAAQTQDAAEPAGAEPAEPRSATRVQPGSGSPELKPVILARAEEAPEETAEEVPEETTTEAHEAQDEAHDEARGEAAEPKPAKRGVLARIGVPILVFAIGVGVGAFGDHALKSKQSSTKLAASIPPVSTTSQPSHTPALSPSGSGVTSGRSSAPSSDVSNPSGSISPTENSASGTSSVAPGTVLGAYVGIQLASGYSVNFLSDAYHPASGTADGPDTMGFFAGSFVDGRFYADRVAILDPTDTGSFTSCLNDTRYQHDVLLSQISTGSSFCVTTGTGHLVLVTVRRLPSSTDANPYAVLDVTVWQSN